MFGEASPFTEILMVEVISPWHPIPELGSRTRAMLVTTPEPVSLRSV
jgi:hypothetical protein